MARIALILSVALLIVYPISLYSQTVQKYVGSKREEIYKAEKELEEKEARLKAELEDKRIREREQREHELKMAAIQAEQEQQKMLQTLLWTVGIGAVAGVVVIGLYRKKQHSSR